MYVGFTNGLVVELGIREKKLEYNWGVLNDGGMASMAMSPCGNFIYTGSLDGVLRQYRTLDRRMHKDYGKVHNASINALGVSPSGNF
jgi:hypothetical protein